MFPDKPCHKQIQFLIKEGQDDFREEINHIFARNGVAFEFDEEGYVIRLGPEALREALASSVFDTGDSELDMFLEGARKDFLDPDLDIRKEALKKLYDAWERLKTLLSNDKKTGIRLLLERAIPEINLRERAMYRTKVE